ncbi:hypothetical protein [Halopelagius fulvigenes]|uniref:Uncharacterized protein n=1 Tax=Halopelagius fulvigenes TaxID=1198324 RepID=A0ABD5TZU0_9EURY
MAPNEIWTTGATLEGLLLDLIGASLVLFPELPVVKGAFVPTRRIDQIKEARHSLFENRRLQRGDEGFREIVHICSQRADIEDIPDLIRAVPSNRFGSGVQFLMEKPNWSPDGDYGKDDIIPLDKYDSETIETRPMVDQWITQYLGELEGEATQVAFLIGLSFLVMGFSLQLLATSCRNDIFCGL